MQTKELRHGGALESEDVFNPGDWCDGGPFGAYFFDCRWLVMVLLGLHHPI